MNKNSNRYILIYSTVMVVTVAAVLAIVSMGLQDRQNRNIMNEKKTAILASVGLAGVDVDRLFNEQIEGMVVDSSGAPLAGYSSEQVIGLLDNLRASLESGRYPLFHSKDGRTIIPVIGKGLWGDIWGYVALAADRNTISGVVFDHKSETPGLGAEITQTPFCAQFAGKSLFDGDRLVSIAVMKGGAPAGDPHAVDAISGGTLTSRGVEEMLRRCMELYAPFLRRADLPTELNLNGNE